MQECGIPAITEQARAGACGTSVGEVMTEDPVTVRESTNLADAVVLLLERRIRRLPVVDESGCVVGLLSRADVIRSTLKEMKSR